MASQTRRQKLANAASCRLLRSRLSPLLDGTLMLITVRGVRTGTDYTLPVQYATDGTTLWVLPGNHERKTWWRNLTRERKVLIVLRGREQPATAQALLGTSTPAMVEAGLLVYFRRYPRLARRFGIVDEQGLIEPQALRALAKRLVLVRIVPANTTIPVAEQFQPAHVRLRALRARLRRRPIPAIPTPRGQTGPLGAHRISTDGR